MRTVNGKEILYSTSFLIGENEEAVLADAPLDKPLVIKAFKKLGEPLSQDLKVESGEKHDTVAVPFLRSGGFSTAISMGTVNGRTITGRMAAVPVPGAMVLYLDLYIDRKPNYGPR